MAKKEVVEYIEKKLKIGSSLQDIKASLLDAGHNIEQIEEAIADVKSVPSRKNHKPASQKKFNWIIVGSVLVVSILFVVLMNIKSENEKIEPSKLLEADIINKPPLQCEEVCEDNDCRMECFQGIGKAISKGDVSVCDMTKNDAKRTECYNIIYFNKAIIDNNPNLCGKINADSLKNQCKNKITQNE